MGTACLQEMAAFIQGVLPGRLTGLPWRLAAATLVFILVFKRYKRFPGVLVAVVGATVVTGVFDLASRAGVSVLGALPQGLPSFTIPWVSLEDIGPLLVGAIAIAVVSFADTSVLSRSLAARSGAYVDPNQEMIGLGAANIAAGFFQGFSISSSASRTPVAESAGSKTQLTGVTGAVAIALLLVFAPTLLQNLPNTALAAVVIASAIGLFEISDLRRLLPHPAVGILAFYRLLPGRGSLWTDPGHLDRHHHRPVGVRLGWLAPALRRVGSGGWGEGLPRYHPLPGCPPHPRAGALPLGCAPVLRQRRTVPGVHVLDAINKSPTPVRWFVVAAEPVTSVDVTAADMLAELDDKLHQAGIQLVFAEMKDPVKDKLKRFGLRALRRGAFLPHARSGSQCLP